MRPIFEATVAQIDVTHGCHLSCGNCTRYVGNHRHIARMTLDQVREAIRSLDGFPGRIGLMGGEPTMHPQFLEILAIFREEIPDRRRREFWTAGHLWDLYEADILATFDRDLIAYNDHTQDTGRHQPLAIAIDEIIDDEELKAELIDNCWVQQQWSPAINAHGAYFCEVAGAQDAMLNKGANAWKVEADWWNKTPEQFRDQRDKFCGNCSAALPLPKFSDGRGGRDGPTKDVVSPGMLEKMLAAGSPKMRRGQYTIWDRKLTRDDIEKMKAGWEPSHFRDFEAHTPEDVKQHLETT